ncbi:granzyme M isoform X3 [Mesocricetus auratus]|uniref:Granzyme M isoform X3 n=1 Tax=Mesocricetus auratus TaxID=10036 RepID=A0A1U8CRM4_MESAU|nr:granzyme M isoform X3 [Mesocricetus auratus]
MGLAVQDPSAGDLQDVLWVRVSGARPWVHCSAKEGTQHQEGSTGDLIAGFQLLPPETGWRCLTSETLWKPPRAGCEGGAGTCARWAGLGRSPVLTGRESGETPHPGNHKSCTRMEVHQSLLLLLALDTLWAAGNTFETHIIGGREAAPHSRPYMASLQKAGSHVCGGVLVHPKWVLTAAHCLSEPVQQLKLVLGLHHLHDLRDPGLTFYIKAAIKHPGYNHNLENDLALLKLDGRVRPSRNVRPLALPRKGQARPAAGAQCSTAGWGITHQGGHLAQALQELDLHVLDTRMCNNSRFWNGALEEGMLCLKAVAKSQAPCKLQKLHRHLQAPRGHRRSPLQPLDQEGHPSLTAPACGLSVQVIWTLTGLGGKELDVPLGPINHDVSVSPSPVCLWPV